MANRALKKTAKVLGGLGAAYVLSDALGPKVRPEDVNEADAAADAEKTRERIERSRAQPAPAPSPTADAPIRSRVVNPLSIQDQDTSRESEDRRALQEAENRLDLRHQANREPAILKKGGSVKGWGMARGARKAKVY